MSQQRVMSFIFLLIRAMIRSYGTVLALQLSGNRLLHAIATV